MKLESILPRSAAITDVVYDFSGVWGNELGSRATIKQVGATLTGSYISAVGGSPGVVSGPLSGWASGYLVSFSVRWGSVAAITSWVGQVVRENGIEAIETLWLMTNATPNPEDPTELWDSVLAGADRFVRATS